MNSENILTLLIQVMVVSLASVGMVEWLKNWTQFEQKRLYSIVGLVVLSVNVIFQLPFMHPTLTWGWSLFTLGLACMQFGYSTLVKMPALVINALVGKIKTT